MMTRDDIRRDVCAVLSAIQTDSGLEIPVLSDDTKPLCDIPGFDSLATVDAEVRLSEVLGVELDRLPFISPLTGKEQSIGEIVAYLAEKYELGTSASIEENLP